MGAHHQCESPVRRAEQRELPAAPPRARLGAHRQHRFDCCPLRVLLRAVAVLGDQGRGGRLVGVPCLVPTAQGHRCHLLVPRPGCHQHRAADDLLGSARQAPRPRSRARAVDRRDGGGAGPRRHTHEPLPAPHPPAAA